MPDRRLPGEAHRPNVCSFCGEIHRGAKAYRECRRRGGRTVGGVTADASAERAQGSPMTRYENDPLGGNKRHHRIASLARQGHKPRRIARILSVPLAEVEAVLKRLADA